jgi:Ca2+-binding EF-hand superfamily protein
MSSRIAACVVIITAASASAQTVPALYSHNGMKATAALYGIEADGPHYAAPRSEASALRAASAVEVFPFLKLSDNQNTVTKNLALIQRIKQPYRLNDNDFNIPDVQDVVFFTETRVVRVRLNLKVAGQPLRDAWVKQLRRYFDFLDRDRDGTLNPFEAEFVFSNNAIQQMLQNGQAFNRPNEPGRMFADFDRDTDGKVSFDEFVAYYAPSTAALLRVQPSINRDQFADTMTEELFKQLDRDGDGKLSKAELADLEKLLPILDQNEDECLAALEFVPNLFNRPRPPVMMNPPRGGIQPQVNPVTQPLQVFRPGAIPETIAEQILIRYDKDKNLRLTKAESGFDDATFAALDRNKDNELSIIDLMNWRSLEPDLTFDLTFSTKQSECVTKLHNGPDGKPPALASLVNIGDTATYIRIGQQQLELGTLASLGLNFNALNFTRTYDVADPENKGYITEKDIAGPQYQFLRILFDVVDRNGDGKMTRQEYLDYYELQQSFTSLPLGMTHVTQTPSLFSMLDENRDGRLSIRELRKSWERLKNLEPGNAEFITKTALQPQATIRYCRANQLFQAVNFNNYNPTIVPTTRGPNWFRKLDRNSDGDLSRAEFPGTPEDFDALDTNKDGLISVEEAEEADKRLKGEKK